MASLKEILLDAKKAVAALVVAVAACVSAGLISGQTAAVITAIAGVVTTVLVYVLGNVSKPFVGEVNPPHPPPAA